MGKYSVRFWTGVGLTAYPVSMCSLLPRLRLVHDLVRAAPRRARYTDGFARVAAVAWPSAERGPKAVTVSSHGRLRVIDVRGTALGHA